MSDKANGFTQGFENNTSQISPSFDYILSSKDIEVPDETTCSNAINLFSLQGLGIDQAAFLNAIAPTFEELPWDFYDVRRKHLEEVQRNYPEDATRLQNELIAYYKGEFTLDQLLSLLGIRSDAFRKQLLSYQPFRRRTIADFNLNFTALNGWQIERTPIQAVAQAVEETDIRAIQRQFVEASESVTDMPLFKQLLCGVAEMTRQVSVSNCRLKMTFWHNRLVVSPGGSSTNAPEGIHQDGADFIVSALVIDRVNVVGGCSKVYGPDKKTELLSWQLEPGQGIFQADAGSSLWHGVSPIEVADTSIGEGCRSTLGFDVYLVRD